MVGKSGGQAAWAGLGEARVGVSLVGVSRQILAKIGPGDGQIQSRHARQRRHMCETALIQQMNDCNVH